MQQIAEGALYTVRVTFDWTFNLVKWAFLNIVWAVVTTVGYILRTGFVGLHLGHVIGAAEGGAPVNELYAQVVKIFEATIKSITHAIGIIPETLKPLIQVTLFSLTQLALEQLHHHIPRFFEHLLKNDAGLKGMRSTVEEVFTKVFHKKHSAQDAELQPSNADIDHAVHDIKENLLMAKDMSTKFNIRMNVNAWEKRSKQRRRSRTNASLTMKELTSLCMETKSKHNHRCGGKGVTKARLQQIVQPYVELFQNANDRLAVRA
mgnify:FL=1